MKKDAVAANLIIQGIEDSEKESYKELQEKTEKVFKALNIGDIDWSSIRRLGKHKAGKSRSVQVKLVRQKDKVRILGEKKKLKGVEGYSKIFINPELTKLEREKEIILREKAKEWKQTNKDIKFIIRGGRLTVTKDKKESHFIVNAEGEVEEV